MNDKTFILSARCIAPMDRPPLTDAAVAYASGRIVAAGHGADIRTAFAGADCVDLGDVVLMPGLINAHTHLELSMCACGDRPTSFTNWVLQLPARVGPERAFADAAVAGAKQSLGFGVTCVGDISQQAHLTRPALRDGPLRVVSFGEALGIGTGRSKFDDLLNRALDRSTDSDFLHAALSPHAPYSVDERDFQRVVGIAREHNLQLATHLAEQPAERDFLYHHAGPFRSLLETIGAWRDDVQTFHGTPVEFAKSVGLLDTRSVLAHVNYCNEQDLNDLADGQASVIWCPRTHAYFGHPPHRWRAMLKRGINVAIGTDSLASSPNLNVVDDLRQVWRQDSEPDAELLWSMVTTRAARALQMEDQVGSITPGKQADFAAFPTTSDRPLEELLESDRLPSGVWVGGTRIEQS